MKWKWNEMIYDYEMDMSKSLTKGISSTVIIAIKQSKFPIKLPTRIRSQTRVRSPLIQKGGTPNIERHVAKMPYWLVVYLPLWKIWMSVGMMTFPISGKS